MLNGALFIHHEGSPSDNSRKVQIHDLSFNEAVKKYTEEQETTTKNFPDYIGLITALFEEAVEEEKAHLNDSASILTPAPNEESKMFFATNITAKVARINATVSRKKEDDEFVAERQRDKAAKEAAADSSNHPSEDSSEQSTNDSSSDEASGSESSSEETDNDTSKPPENSENDTDNKDRTRADRLPEETDNNTNKTPKNPEEASSSKDLSAENSENDNDNEDSETENWLLESFNELRFSDAMRTVLKEPAVSFETSPPVTPPLTTPPSPSPIAPTTPTSPPPPVAPTTPTSPPPPVAPTAPEGAAGCDWKKWLKVAAVIVGAALIALGVLAILTGLSVIFPGAVPALAAFAGASVAVAGWGLFGCGIAGAVIGFSLSSYSIYSLVKKASTTP